MPRCLALLACSFVAACDGGGAASDDADAGVPAADAAACRGDCDARPADAARGAGDAAPCGAGRGDCGTEPPADADAGDAAPCGAGHADGDCGTPPPEPPDAGPPLAPQNAWGPAARLGALGVPADAPSARRAGCAVFGSNVGTGLHNLVLLAGGIDRYVRPDARGRVPVVVLLRAAGWPEGARVAELAQLDLTVVRGAQNEANEFVVDPQGWNAPASFAATRVAAGGWLEAPPGGFELPVPVPGGFVLSLPVHEGRIAGRLFVDGPGFGVADGLLTGYVADATLLAEIGEVRALCAGEGAPSVCALIGGILSSRTDEEVRDLLVGQTGGYDVHLDDAGHPYACDPDRPCNALSVCLQFAAEGVVVAGEEIPQP